MNTAGGHADEHSVRVVGFAGQHVAGALGGRQQVGHAPAIGLLAGAEHHAQRVASEAVRSRSRFVAGQQEPESN